MTSKFKLIKAMVDQTNGELFGVSFIKRTTGERRDMVARIGVVKGVTGEGRTFDPDEKELIGVYDVQKAAEINQKWRSEHPGEELPDELPEKAFRFISAESVLHLKISGQVIHFVDDSSK